MQIRVYSGELEEADAEVCEMVRDQKWAKLGLGDEGRQVRVAILDELLAIFARQRLFELGSN